MLDPDAVERQLAETRRRLLAWSNAIGQGTVQPTLPQRVREDIDLLTCLLDEAPEWQHDDINYLVDRCEAMASRLRN